jgi:hypothetical protein
MPALLKLNRLCSSQYGVSFQERCSSNVWMPFFFTTRRLCGLAISFVTS